MVAPLVRGCVLNGCHRALVIVTAEEVPRSTISCNDVSDLQNKQIKLIVMCERHLVLVGKCSASLVISANYEVSSLLSPWIQLKNGGEDSGILQYEKAVTLSGTQAS